ncbi:Cerato-platanin [Schizophyllum amplum]|uniref:Cerato-platanin n=1 Tax=Schizophyllum amplum TaxID=97359 RepID=A0A550CRE3_9AGAR|nr:Cerato-platanin [Auriculariopsis ampla]
MKCIAALTSLLAIPTALAAVVYYDTVYDNPDESMSAVACSNGDNGLITRYGFTDLGDIPNFPNAGAAFAVDGWNSEGCGTCWQLTYQASKNKLISINVLAVDVAGVDGFVISRKAMDSLTGNRAVELGVADVTYKQIEPELCGLPSDSK